jgi:uncharacterized protein (DUF1499 family)
MGSRSRVASTAGAIGAFAAILFFLGLSGSYVGLLPGRIGFRIYGIGLLVGLLGLLVGLVGVWHTRASRDRAGRSRAWSGVGVGLVMTSIVIANLGSLRNVPPINDITTDPDDPPSFSRADQFEANRDRDLGYPGDSFASRQRTAYPDLGPIHLDAPRGAAFREAEAAATALGWKISHRNAELGVIEATDTTEIFKFVDDIAIRIRSEGERSVVDIRSKSRDGLGDLGTNAARIRTFRHQLQNYPPPG